MMQDLQQVLLSSGHYMPLVGFGTAGLGDQTAQAVTWALEAGYRLIDSAQVFAKGEPKGDSQE